MIAVGRKLKFILSDLHLGAGYADQDNQLEDFIADQELVNFLHTIQHECDREQLEVELIINGDFFEFLQVPAVEHYNPAETYPREAYLDSSEQASVQRLNLIVRGHPEVFDALSDFMYVEHPQRRITIIKGNHDVNLFWPRVKSRLREILGASGTRASLLLFADEFVSREKIYVEHGHQRAEKINAYQDFFNPRSSDNPGQLHYPTGSCFIIECFNEIEQQYWFVDHLKPVTAFIWTALPWDFDAAGQMLSHLKCGPATDGMLNDNVELKHLLQELQNPAQRQSMSQQYAADPDFRQQFHQQVRQLLQVMPVNGDIPHTQLAPVADPLEMAQANRQRQHHLLRQAATEIADQEGANVIVFGHTHNPVQEQLENGSTYINAGCWIEDFSQAEPETWQALFGGDRLPQKEAAPLSYVRIDYNDNDIPTGKLMYFNQSDDAPRQKPGWLARLLTWGSK
jgi:UDP-2,3-diacylglucosamine pyrophosphatase LpxH